MLRTAFTIHYGTGWLHSDQHGVLTSWLSGGNNIEISISLSQYLAKLRADHRTFSPPHRIGGDIPQNVQLRRLRTTIATTACGDSVSNTRVLVELAAAAPTQRRRRPLADEYKCKEQGRGHTRAYGNARRVSRHSLQPHMEPASSLLPHKR